MNTINQRLKDVLKQKDLSGKHMSVELEIDYRQFNNWLNGTKPSVEGLQKFINYFPDLNARWLLTGEGSMLSNVIYAIDKENHEANGEDGGGSEICTNPNCKKEIAYLKEIINSKEEALKLYREAGKKETGNGNYIQSPQDTKRDKAS